MCGSVSAVGLREQERRLWPFLRERLREPGHLMALMRGVLGDTEVAAVVAVTPQGAVTPRAILAIPEVIVREIDLSGDLDLSGDQEGRRGVRRARIGGDQVEVLVDRDEAGRARPVAILTTPWIEQYLLLYARRLWHRR